MVRIFWFVVFGLGCGDIVPEPVVVDQGYGMRVESVNPPKGRVGPYKLNTSCTSYQRDGGIYRITFCQKMIDSLVVNLYPSFCDSLLLLQFETVTYFDPMGKNMYQAIIDGDRGSDTVLNRGDSLVFYLQIEPLEATEGYHFNKRSFWIDSAGVDVVYELWFYNPISRGYGFRRKNRWEWR